MKKCAYCGTLGWVLDANVKGYGPVTAELIPCPIPGCEASGRKLELLSVNLARFTNVSRQFRRIPSERGSEGSLVNMVMSVSQ